MAFAHSFEIDDLHTLDVAPLQIGDSSLSVMTRVAAQNKLSKTGSRCIMEDNVILLAVPLHFRNQE
jgi:hypothetical protein